MVFRYDRMPYDIEWEEIQNEREEVDMRIQKLAVLIDEWYLEWKDNMTDSGQPHKLGFAKEDLKKRIEKELGGKKDEI